MNSTRYAATIGTCALLLTGCASLGSTTSSTGTTGAAPVTTAAAPATSSLSQLVNQWYTGGGQANIDTLSNDMTAVSTDSSDDPASVANDCQTMLTDVTAAQAADPIPDKQAQLSWSSALGHLHAGASDCAAGAANMDATQVNQGATEITEGTTDLTAVATRIKTIAGQ